jgi:hypothetical protein
MSTKRFKPYVTHYTNYPHGKVTYPLVPNKEDDTFTEDEISELIDALRRLDSFTVSVYAENGLECFLSCHESQRKEFYFFGIEVKE